MKACLLEIKQRPSKQSSLEYISIYTYWYICIYVYINVHHLYPFSQTDTLAQCLKSEYTICKYWLSFQNGPSVDLRSTSPYILINYGPGSEERIPILSVPVVSDQLKIVRFLNLPTDP